MIAYFLAACLALPWIPLAGFNLEKMDLWNAHVHNNTAEHKTILVTARYQKTSGETMRAELEFSLNPGETITLNPQSHLAGCSGNISLLHLDETSRTSAITAARQTNPHHAIITLSVEPNAALHGFEFVPQYTDFHTGLKCDENLYRQCIAGSANYTKATTPKSPSELLHDLTALYQTHFPRNVIPSKLPKIPKAIHHIWLGSKIPEHLLGWYKTFIDLHPTWDHILWTDQDCVHSEYLTKNYPLYKEIHIRTLGTLINQKLFDDSKNYGEKSDILRLEILKRFGGVYADIDFQCFEPLDVLHHCYDFYASMLPLDTGLLTVNNGLIAARPEHPIINAAIGMMQSSQQFSPHHYFAIILATGPVPITRAVWQEMGKHGNCDIIFPCSFFYPLPYRKGSFERHVDCRPESFTVHYCTKTWARASAHVS